MEVFAEVVFRSQWKALLEQSMRFTRMASAVLVLSVTSQVASSGEPTAFPRAMHGQWVCIAAEWAGKPVPKEIARRLKVTVKERAITVSPLVFDDGKIDIQGAPAEFSYRLDPAKSPKAIDLVLKDSEGEYRQLGIYEVGQSQLKLCWQHDGKRRPAEFKTVAEPTQMLLVLKRAPAADQPPTFEAPKAWQAIDAGPALALARFQIKEEDHLATVVVTGLPGQGGGLAANVNRWRAQVGLKALTDEEAQQSLQPIRIRGIPGHSIDLTGTKDPDKVTQRIRAVIVTRGDQTWFFRLTGPASLVAHQMSAFDEFIQSIQFEK